MDPVRVKKGPDRLDGARLAIGVGFPIDIKKRGKFPFKRGDPHLHL